jgi:predicted RNA-binding Zn-ribbon protein involved in translation (DUF1610 family)
VYADLNIRKDDRPMSLVMKLCLTAVALCLLALALPSSGLFGDANALGVAMFLGLFFSVPATLLGFLALLSLTTGSARAVKSSSGLYVGEDQLQGTCPNCNATIPVDFAECPNCRASFGEHSVWRVQKSNTESKDTHV